MADHMIFPKTADDFIEQYSFKDEKQEHTNGAELIPVFRVKQMMEHYIANGATVQQWIPVSERLPERDEVVLCYKANRGIRFGVRLDATYANGVQAFMESGKHFAFGATHWMPLPEPPKED